MDASNPERAGWQTPGDLLDLSPTPTPAEPPRQVYVVPVSPTTGTNGFAIASLVLGIVWIYWIGSVLAIIFGAIAMRQCREHNQGGRGMAVSGLVLGIVGMSILALVAIIGVAGGY